MSAAAPLRVVLAGDIVTANEPRLRAKADFPVAVTCLPDDASPALRDAALAEADALVCIGLRRAPPALRGLRPRRPLPLEPGLIQPRLGARHVAVARRDIPSVEKLVGRRSARERRARMPVLGDVARCQAPRRGRGGRGRLAGRGSSF